MTAKSNRRALGPNQDPLPVEMTATSNRSVLGPNQDPFPVEDDPKTVKTLLTWAVLGMLTILSVYVLLQAPSSANAPSDLSKIVAWGVSGFLMAIVAWGTPMFLLGGVRRSPLQSWMMPHVQLVKDTSLVIKQKLEQGVPLTEGEYQFVGNLSQHIAVRIAGIAFFAGLMLLRF